ncbi:MAG TPA: SDR family oxidoreductase [Terriglobales bacterium]
MPARKTAIITGATGGIGSGLVEGFLDAGYNVVGTSRDANTRLTSSSNLILLVGDIDKQQTAIDALDAAIKKFGSVDVLVNVAGIFLNKAFLDFKLEDFNALVSTNLLGFFYMTQEAVRQMVKQKSGCVITISAALADRPIAGRNGSISMMTKGGLNTASMNLAVEFEPYGIRFNTVAPGEVNTPMHSDDPKDAASQSAAKRANINDIVDAILYLAEAAHVNGEILHVDGGVPPRRW